MGNFIYRCCHHPDRVTHQLLTSPSKPPFQHGYIKKIKATNHSKIYSIYLCVGGIQMERAVIPSCVHIHLLPSSSPLLIEAEHT